MLDFSVTPGHVLTLFFPFITYPGFQVDYVKNNLLKKGCLVVFLECRDHSG